jgi:tRNA(adenine34) deaminase
MRACISMAHKKGTPFGAALINDEGAIICLAANSSSSDGPIAHAELNVLQMAHKDKIHASTLHLITTCEPCAMCTGAAIWNRVKSIYYAVSIEEAANYLPQIHMSCSDIVQTAHYQPEVYPGILRAEAIELFR